LIYQTYGGIRMSEPSHKAYVNARGELIANGTSREVWCGWEHRPTCPLCQNMADDIWVDNLDLPDFGKYRQYPQFAGEDPE
jgi:hypothetical protein